MKEIIKQVQTIKVKTLFFAICGIWLLSLIYTYSFVDTYHFHKISETSIETQKQCLDHFLSVFKKHNIPLILFDVDILPRLFKAMPKSWHKSDHKCKTLCKYHPEEKNVVTFAAQAIKFEGKAEAVMSDLKELGYTSHLSMDVDPRLLVTEGNPSYIPTYLWMAKNDHVIHVAFLHERLGSYVWIGPVRDDDWKETVNQLAPALTDGWHSMEKIGAKFPTYAQAFDKSQRFLGFPLEIDGHRLNVPYHITAFLNEYKNSHFIECDHKRAREYKSQHETYLSPEEIDFKVRAKKLIIKAKEVLDGLNVPFWLSSGTCLGWFRQCDIIPYSVDVDFGILIYDHNLKIVEAMHEAGLVLIHKFGKTGDSLEWSFMGEDNIKLDIFFFYTDFDHYWNGGTQAHDGRKYKYRFPKFDLCWTEFLEIKIRVPCNPEVYIEANYGKDWMQPVKNWQWNLHPPNIETNGKWDEEEMDVAVQIYERTDEHIKQIDELRKQIKRLEDVPSPLEMKMTRRDYERHHEMAKQLMEEQRFAAKKADDPPVGPDTDENENKMTKNKISEDLENKDFNSPEVLSEEEQISQIIDELSSQQENKEVKPKEEQPNLQ